jgi:hypothetical protein
MNNLKKTLAFVAASAAFGLPAYAQMDAGSMTCGDFLSLEGGGKNDAVRAVALYVNDAANLATTSTASEAIQGKTNMEIQQKIEGDCGGQPPETNLISVLK